MWPFSRRLENALNATTRVRVHGVRFTIRKINPLDYLQGSMALKQAFDTYRHNPGKQAQDLTPAQAQAIRAHYSDVLAAAVVEPKIRRGEQGEGIPVDHLLTEWELAQELYERIMEFTYGKKKLRAMLRGFQKTAV